MEEANPIVTPSPADLQKHLKIQKEVRIALNEIIDQVQFVLSSGPHQHYFLGEKLRRQKIKEANKQYNSILESKLLVEIQSGVTKINKIKREYSIQPKSSPSPQEKIEKQKVKLQLRKKQAVEALKEIMTEEKQILKQRNSLLRESQGPRTSQIVVPHNPQWKHHLVIALKRNKQLDRSLHKKSQIAEERAEFLREQAIKAKIQLLQKKRSESICGLQERRKREKNEKQKQQLFKKNCQQFVKKMKPQKYTFQIMKDTGQKKLKLLQLQRQQKIREFAQKRNQRDWESLKQHEAKYYETINERKQEWLNRFENQLQSRVLKKYNSSVFAQRLKQSETQKYFEEQEKQKQRKNFQTKIKSYSSSVLENYRPKRFIQSSNQERTAIVRESLNRNEEREKGLHFLNEAKKLHKQGAKKQQKGPTSLPIINNQYKDYLRQQPKRAKDSTNSTRFYSVLSQKKGEWAASAKSILQKMDKTYHKKPNVILDSAFKKIQLLQALM